MPNFREIEERILANGRVEGEDLEVLRRFLYADGKVGRPEADFLVELHKRAQNRSPAFERFFYKAVKDHLLADGRIDAEETSWLRQMVSASGKLEDQERKFLHELKGEVREFSPEF